MLCLRGIFDSNRNKYGLGCVGARRVLFLLHYFIETESNLASLTPALGVSALRDPSEAVSYDIGKYCLPGAA